MGPVQFGAERPRRPRIPAVYEANIRLPRVMLAIGDSQFMSAAATQEPGGDDALFSGLASGHGV
jgi:hypothetical protein